MRITQYLVSKTDKLVQVPEVSPGNHGFSMFNGGSVEIETAEFLYAFVGLIKPKHILETGTHAGVSSAYMAQALIDYPNPNGGKLVTLEFDKHWVLKAKELWTDLEQHDQVSCIHISSLEYTPVVGTVYDFVFLDSEPQLRFDEFIRFWPLVRNGGFIAIHDLHPHLGHSGIEQHGVMDWPYGDFREKLGPYITGHEVQTVSFPTPRGFTLFQKRADDFNANNLLLGRI